MLNRRHLHASGSSFYRIGSLAVVATLFLNSFLDNHVRGDGQAAKAEGTETEVAATEPQRLTAGPELGRVVSFWIVGGTSRNARLRQVSSVRPFGGWSDFVQRNILPQLRWGVRRIQIHNPFGTLPDEPMQFDQYVHADDAGLLFLTQGFVEAWKPVVEGDFTDGEPVEVIAYFGKLEGDPDFEALRDRPAQWLDRAMRSLQKPLQAGMSIGLDSAGVAPRDSMTFHLAEMLRGLGVRVYIEPRPDADKPHWFDYPVIVLHDYWYRSNPDRFRDAASKASNSDLTGEIILLMVSGDRDGPRWQLETSRKVIGEGHTAAAALWKLPLQRISLEEFVDTEGRELGGDQAE